MTNSTVATNFAAGDGSVGGGLVVTEKASATLTDCTVTDNYSYYNSSMTPSEPTGAGLACSTTSTTSVTATFSSTTRSWPATSITRGYAR